MILKAKAKDKEGNWVIGEPHLKTSLYPHIHTFEEVSRKVIIQEDTVRYFSNMYDEEGDEIYEGDIVQWKNDGKLYVVVFKHGMFYGSVEYCHLHIYGGFPLHALAENQDEFKCKIVGNIYDNKELIINPKYKSFEIN